MKILLIAPRYSLDVRKSYDYILPIGLGYICASLLEKGFEVDCLNLNHFDGQIKEIIHNKLNSKKYDLVGTGNNALGYAVTEKIINAVKEHESKPKVILGGPIITSEPKLIFEALNPSFGVLGEGEETIVELIDVLKKGKNLEKVKGIIYRNFSGEIIKTPSREPPKNLDDLPFPNYDLFGIEEQMGNMSTNFMFFDNLFDKTRMYPILASRSCPYQCTFCYHDSRYRKRSMDNIMKEIKLVVKKYKINLLAIHDECFAIDETRLRDFCKRMNILRKEIDWDLKWSCQLRVETSDKELLKIMKQAGCAMIGYGLESYSPTVLKSMKKFISPEQINIAIQNLFEVGIALQGFFIFGDIAETNETAKETLDYWKENAKGQIGLGFIQPYPGSEIYKRCLEKGIIKDKLQFIKNLVVNDVFNMTENMTDNDLHELNKKILRYTGKYTKFTKPTKLKKQANGKYEVSVRCPFCNSQNTYKNCKIENRISYGFNLICRNCYLRFFTVSFLQKIAYANYDKVRALRDFQLKIKRSFKKKRL